MLLTPDRRWFGVLGLLLALFNAGCISERAARSSPAFWRQTDRVVLQVINSEPTLAYNLRPPSGTIFPLESGGYFHPLTTPRGVPVTDFAPADHKHHRGVFLAWVEMHGAQDADFWGWGAHAPIQDRRIVNRSVTPVEVRGGQTRFRAENDWMAGRDVVLRESLECTATGGEVTVLDLHYQLTPHSDLTLARWAFSGFCVRVRKDGEITAHSPQGLVTLPNPVHTKPESDWPDAPWYAFSIQLSDGSQLGAAVINHPANPPALWHNHRDTRMLNPCIVAPAAVTLQARQPLHLRYRVVTFDGPVPTTQLNRLAAQFPHTVKAR